MSVDAHKSLWRALTVSLLVLFVYASILVKLSSDWWHDENYSHGLLIPFVIGYILWSDRNRLAYTARKPSFVWGSGAIVVGLLAAWAGTAGAELYLQRMSLVLVLAGLAIYFWGFQLLKSVLVPFSLLILAIPIPAIIFNQIAFPLQLFASRCAVASMRMLDIPVLREGNVIELMPLGAVETKKLEVVEACSGIRSLMTLVTLAVVFAYFTRPQNGSNHGPKGGGRTWFPRFGFWRAGIIVASAVPIAIFTNALRVSGTGILAQYYGTRVADGFFHSFSGWMIYVVAFLLVFAVGWLVDRFDPNRNARKPIKDAQNQETGKVRSDAKVGTVKVEGAD
jgi:exosortase